ncbi:MAG TPA: ERF family protein, partial [Nitrobacter sp.]|nr:ERF family protein [Nitrobacter sp.]
RAATDPAVDVDKLERLLAMQERVLARDAEQAFHEAMKAAQEDIKPVVANKKNPQTKSDYADLEALSDAIDPIIRSHGFTPSFGSDASPLPDHYRVTCRLAHTAGHARDYHADVPIDTTGIKGERNKTTTHGWGSAMTYGRRYLKLLAFDVTVTTKATRDDDGNAAGNGAPINKEQVAILNGLADAVGADKIGFCRCLKIDAIPDLPQFRYTEAVSLLTAKNSSAARKYLTGGK